jgi:PIN domain nuclease of toxin-antitoxin system
MTESRDLLLLDTHVWIWYVCGTNHLNAAAREKLSESLYHNKAYLAAITLWEISMLEKKQRIAIDMPCLSWINKSIQITGVQVLPLTPEIAVESCHLPDDFHNDPADRIITATARVKSLTLVTRDERVLAFGAQGFVSTWSV